jgi:fructuronate reductase
VKYFTNETLQISSLTVTEKGYQLTNNNGEYLQIIKDDIKNGPSKCYHLMSILTSLLYERYKSNQKALALVSLDNMSENGNKFKQAILAIAEEWKKLNHVTQEFLDYINNEDKISFP